MVIDVWKTRFYMLTLLQTQINSLLENRFPALVQERVACKTGLTPTFFSMILILKQYHLKKLGITYVPRTVQVNTFQYEIKAIKRPYLQEAQVFN